jgi:hypothetical protein
MCELSKASCVQFQGGPGGQTADRDEGRWRELPLIMIVFVFVFFSQFFITKSMFTAILMGGPIPCNHTQ